MSAYRPVENTHDDFSVYYQHKYYFESQGEPELCPRKVFCTHLQEDITRFTDMGDDVVLGTDFNADIRHDPDFGHLMAKCTLQDSILLRHGLEGPPTRSGGSKTLDALCLSSALTPMRSGYLVFEEGLSDHRPLFTILHREEVLG